MTRIILEIKDDRRAALLRTILRCLNIPIVREEKEKQKPDLNSFYNQFKLDLSNFRFDRQEANER
jgi:hypothetical protein